MSILLPVAEGEQSLGAVKIDGQPMSPGNIDQFMNLMAENLSETAVNKDTWTLDPMPRGTFSGSFTTENIGEVGWQIMSGQNRGFETINAKTSLKAQTDFHGYLVDSTFSTSASFNSAGSDYAPLDLIEANYDNSFDDPYGRDDMGFASIPTECSNLMHDGTGGTYTWTGTCANNMDIDVEVESSFIHYGEDSYHTYVAVGVSAQFTHQQVMGGASELWIRSPLDGYYNPTTSFISIYEVSDLEVEDSFSIELQTVASSTTESTGSHAFQQFAYQPVLNRPTKASVPGGTLVYDATLAQSDVVLNDYSELGFYQIDNGSSKVTGSFNKLLTGTNCKPHGYATYDFTEGILDPIYMPLIPCNIWPGNNFDVRQAHSEQTQQIFSQDHTPGGLTDYWAEIYPYGIPRTYHRANTFIYPNQPYLFVFYLELLANDPIFSISRENIHGDDQESFYVMGHYNYTDPDQFCIPDHWAVGTCPTGNEQDGVPDYAFAPNYDTHYTENRTLKFDAGMSIMFTQGQSQDMAGYRFNADNTTVTFMKELPEPVLHEAGHDEQFGFVCTEVEPIVCTIDDELDYVSLYMPFINHDNKPLTIEYIAFAYEETDNGFKFRPWYNASSPAWTCGAADVLACSLAGGLDGYLKYTAPRYNFYYSGFSYRGKDVNDAIANNNPGYEEDQVTNYMRPQPLNDEMQDSEFHANQHLNYYLHTTELVPANGTTHILYVMKIAGHHHWEANLENSRYFASEDVWHDRQGRAVDSAFFHPSLDLDKDGRTDSTQQNSTDITLLISKPTGTPADVPLALPIYPTGIGGFEHASESAITAGSGMFFEGISGDAVPIRTGGWDSPYNYPARGAASNSPEDWYWLYPNVYSAPLNGWTIHSEEWDREEGYRVDGMAVQSLFGMQGVDSACGTELHAEWKVRGAYNIQRLCDVSHHYSPKPGRDHVGWEGTPGMLYQSIQGISLHQAKNQEYDCLPMPYTSCPMADGREYEQMLNPANENDAMTGIFEINGRGASYIRPYDYSRHNTELMASVSLSNGRFTEVRNIEGEGFLFLDNAFPNRMVINQKYEITIYARTEWVYNPDYTENQQLAVNIYEGVNAIWDEYGDEVMMTSQILWQAGGAMIDAAKGLWDGSITMELLIADLMQELWPALVGFGSLIFQGMVYIVGEIMQLFAEWGIHLDEIAVGLLHVFMYITGFWFVRFILRITSTLILKFKGVEQY